MGFITDYALGTEGGGGFPGRDRHRRRRRDAAGDVYTPAAGASPAPARPASLVQQAAARRLLGALGSRAPAGWTDDRWEQVRQFTGIQYVAIHRISDQMSQGEFQVFHEDESHPEGKRPVSRDDPPEGGRDCRPYDLVKLLKRPNEEDSFGDLMYVWNQQLDLTGTSLTWTVLNQLKYPYRLYPIHTPTAVPQPTVTPEFPQGCYRVQPIYPYGPFTTTFSQGASAGALISAEHMLRVKHPHPYIRGEGYSPLTAMRLHLDEVNAMDRSRWYSMFRGLNPSAVLNFDEVEGAEPLPEPEIERIRADFEANQHGPENHGKLFVAAPGSKLEPWGTRPIDMDYQSGWDQIVGFILGAFGITKPAAGMVEDSSYATLFATLKQLYWLTLEPKCNQIGAKLTRFLGPYFGDRLIVEVRCRPINDHEVKGQKLDKLIQGKAITKNELRRELDMPQTEEPWGDEIAGYEAPPEQPAMPGVPDAGQSPVDPDQIGMVPQEQTDEQEIANTAPTPGSLSVGALGPRKSFYQNGRAKKVLTKLRGGWYA